MEVAVNSEQPDNKEWLSHVKIGQRFDLELLDQRKSRCSCELVGYKAGKYVLFRVDDDTLPDRFFINGLAVVCRFLVEDSVGECFAFKSELLQLTRFPDKLAVVSFPAAIQRRALRNERRNSIFIPASVRLNLEVVQHSRSFHGHVIDVSSGGCRFLFDPSHQGSKVIWRLWSCISNVRKLVLISKFRVKFATPDWKNVVCLSGSSLTYRNFI